MHLTSERKSRQKRLHQKVLMDEFSMRSSSRCANSLVILSKRLVRFSVEHGDNGVIDLTAASHHLNVRKRRLYDVSNVLEGIGMIKKEGRSKVRWMIPLSNVVKIGANPRPFEIEDDLPEQIDALRNEEVMYDNLIDSVKKKVKELGSNVYLTNEDILTTIDDNNRVSLVVSAAEGTTIQIPHPQDGISSSSSMEKARMCRYQAFLHSDNQGIDVMMINKIPYGSPPSNSTMDKQITSTTLSKKGNVTYLHRWSDLTTSNLNQQPR